MNRREKSVDTTRDPPSNSRAKKSQSAEPFNSSHSSCSSSSRKKSKFAFWTNLSFWSKPTVQPVVNKVPLGERNGESSYPCPPEGDEDNLEQDLGSSYESVNSIATTTSFAFVSPKKLPKGRRIPVDDESGSSRTLPGQNRAREAGMSVRLGLKKKYGLQSCESLEHVESRGGTLQRRRARLHPNANLVDNYELPSTSRGFCSDSGTLTGTDTARRKRKAPPAPIPSGKESSNKVTRENTQPKATEQSSAQPVKNASPELPRIFPHPIPVASTSTLSSKNVELLKVTSLSGEGPSTKISRVPSKRESYPGVSAQQRKGRLNCACSTSIFASHSRRAKFPCGSDHCIHRKGVHVKGKKKAPPPPNPFGDPDSEQPSAEVKKVPRNPFYEDPEESTPPNIAKELNRPSCSIVHPSNETIPQTSANESQTIKTTQEDSSNAQVSTSTPIASSSTEIIITTSHSSNSNPGSNSVAAEPASVSNQEREISQIEVLSTSGPDKNQSSNAKPLDLKAPKSADNGNRLFVQGGKKDYSQPMASENTASASGHQIVSSKASPTSSVIYATIATTASTGFSRSLPVTTTAPGVVSVSSSTNLVRPVTSSNTPSQNDPKSSPVHLRTTSANYSSTSSSVPLSFSGTQSSTPSRVSSTSIFTYISPLPVVSANDEVPSTSGTSSSTITSVPSTSTSTTTVTTCSLPALPSTSTSPLGVSPTNPHHSLTSSPTLSPEATALADEIAQNLLNDEQERMLLNGTSAPSTCSSPSSASSKTKSRGSIFSYSRTPKKVSAPSNSGDLESLLHSSQTLRAQVTAVDQQVRAHLVEESPPVSPGKTHHDKSPMFFFSNKSSRKSLPPATIKELPSTSCSPPPTSESLSSPKVTLRPWYKRLSGGGSSSAGSSKPKPSVISLPKFSDLDKEATRIVEENKRRSAELAFNANARTLIDIFNETFEPITPSPAEESERDLQAEDSNGQTNRIPESASTQSTTAVASTSTNSVANQTATPSTTSSESAVVISSSSTPNSRSGAIPKASVSSSSSSVASPVVSTSSVKSASKEPASSSTTFIPFTPLSAKISKVVTSNLTAATSPVVTPIPSTTSITTATSCSTTTTPSVVTPIPSATPKTASVAKSSSQTEEPKTIAVVQPQAKKSNTPTSTTSTISSSLTTGTSVMQMTSISSVTSASASSRQSATNTSSSITNSSTSTSPGTPSSPVSSPGEDWSCPRCTLKNSYWRALCEACYLRKDSGVNQPVNSMSSILHQVNSNGNTTKTAQPVVTKTSSTASVSSPITPTSTTTTSPAKPTQAVKPKASSSAPACENFLSQLPSKEIPGKKDDDKNKLLQQNSGVRLVEDPEVEELSLERLRRARLAFFQKDQEQKASQLASSERTPRGPSPGNKRNNLTTPSNSSSIQSVPKHSVNVFDDGEDSFLDTCTSLVPPFPSTFVSNIPPCLPGPSSASPCPGGGWRPLLAPITEADANLYCLSEWDRIYENWELPSDDSPQRPATVPGPLPTSLSYNPNFLASAPVTHINTLSEEEDESVLEMERTRKHRTYNTHNKSAAGSSGAMGGVGDLFAVEENERGVAALLRKLEWAIGAGEHRLAASLAHDLALLKVKVAALGPATPTDPINIRVYVEDRFMQQGPFLVQVWESMRVSELKAKIESDWGIPVNFQKWILGQQMAEGDTAPLASFKLKNNSLPFLYLVTPNIHQKPPKASPCPPLVPPKAPQLQVGGPSVGNTSGPTTSSSKMSEPRLQNGHVESVPKPSGSRSPSKLGQSNNIPISNSELKTVPTISTANKSPTNTTQLSSVAAISQTSNAIVRAKTPECLPVASKPDKIQDELPGNREARVELKKPVVKSAAQSNSPKPVTVRKENTENVITCNTSKLSESKTNQNSPISAIKVSPKVSRDEKTRSTSETTNKPPPVPVVQAQQIQLSKTGSQNQSNTATINENQNLSTTQIGSSPIGVALNSTAAKINAPINKPLPINLKKDDISRDRSDSDCSKSSEQKAAPLITPVEAPKTSQDMTSGVVRGRSNSLQQKLAHLRQAAEQAFGKTFGAQPASADISVVATSKTNGIPTSTTEITPTVSAKDDPRPKPRVKKVSQHPKLSVFVKEESSSSGGEDSSSSSKINIRGKVRIQNPVDGFCQTTLEFPKSKNVQVNSIAERTSSPVVMRPSSSSSSEMRNGFSPAELEDIRMHIPSPVEQFESKPNSPQPPDIQTGSSTSVLENSKSPKNSDLGKDKEPSKTSPALSPEPVPVSVAPTAPVAPILTEPVEQGQPRTVNSSPQNLLESAVPNAQQIPSSHDEKDQNSFPVQSTPVVSNQPATNKTEQSPNDDENSTSIPITVESVSDNSSSISPITPAATSLQQVDLASTPRKSHLPPVILRAGKPPPGPAAPPSSNGLPGRPHFLSHRRVSQIEIPAQFKQDVATTPSSLKKVTPSFPSYSGSKTSFNQSPKPYGAGTTKEPEKKSLLQRKNSDSSIANLVLDATDDLSSLGAAALPPQSYEKKESNVDTYLRMLEDLEKLDLIPCAESFDCPVCFLPLGPGEGVTLRDCLHNFCRECLIGAVKYADASTVGCPFRDDSYSCTSSLQEREIKALVPPDVFEAYLARSVKLAERVMTNTFHCRTSDCPGWCIFEDDVNSFLCPVCKKRNCLTCQAIHEDMDCRQYQRQMAIAAETDEDAKSSRLMLEKMIERGEALDCPACHVVLLKKWGCDWVRCSYCKTEICWVTKGFRWGPGGKGDTSGGCKCGVNGVRCHPKCTYCH